MSKKTARKIQEFRYNTTLTEVPFFLRLCSVYWRFEPRLFKLVVLLNWKGREEEPEMFTILAQHQIVSSETVKNALSNSPFFILPSVNR